MKFWIDFFTWFLLNSAVMYGSIQAIDLIVMSHLAVLSEREERRGQGR